MGQESESAASEQWFDYMLAGEFEEVWKLSDAGLKARAGKPEWHLPRHFQHIWTGEPLQGKRVLVRCYHGLGDTVQFIRYMSLIKNIADKVIVWTQKELIPLVQTVSGVDEVLPLHDGSPEAAYDVDIEIMECPHIFRSTLATIPAEVPYLHVTPESLPKNGGKLNVGLVWQAGDWDARRSIPFTLLAPLFAIQGVRIHILQASPEQAGWDGSSGINPGPMDLPQYAGFIKGLDLMISVDSMPVHLAGALGVPVWNLLRAEADWRWMKDRANSPWYPTMRLFRQENEGEWEGVITKVAAELAKLTRRSTAHIVS